MNQSLISNSFELERSSVSATLGLDFNPAVSSAFLDLFRAAETLRKNGAPLLLQFVGISRGTDAAAVAATYSKAATTATAAQLLYLDATGNGIWAEPDMMGSSSDGFTPRETALPTRNDLISWGAIGRLLALASDETTHASLIKFVSITAAALSIPEWSEAVQA